MQRCLPAARLLGAFCTLILIARRLVRRCKSTQHLKHNLAYKLYNKWNCCCLLYTFCGEVCWLTLSIHSSPLCPCPVLSAIKRVRSMYSVAHTHTHKCTAQTVWDANQEHWKCNTWRRMPEAVFFQSLSRWHKLSVNRCQNKINK